MAKIRCPGCKSIISDRREPVNCPWCGSSLAAAYTARPFVPGAQCRIWPSWRGWTAAALLLGIASCLISIGYTQMVPGVSADHAWKVHNALATCQDQIQTLSPAGEVPPLPDAKNQGTYPEFYFVWPKDTRYYSPSDKDINVPAATCRGDLRSGRIVELFMNGQDVATVLQPHNF
jgi:hypothetical protein